ncbi:MAG: hypothetical protein LBE92_08360 [Chryseobacterium sp.]|jgi:hypothetical protein|uniref:hypothetical protein n=1 Tax=Chryseobacterium sp. TaxID=1871047 RepID=UPI002827871C|nr:hypothetical protein [Chryseobacterium sp.]MDR2236122.1 hypothetical protein [Chryseobacterium sp.]
MNRRTLLKTGLLAGTFSLIPFSGAFASPEIFQEPREKISPVIKKYSLVNSIFIFLPTVTFMKPI